MISGRSFRERRSPADARRGGQVLIMALLAMAVLAGLIYYVYNVGRQVNDRLTAQVAADAAAISGATWMARSMNVVAMNNVAQAKMLASVVVLDSLPLATQMSLEEATAWERCLQTQLALGVPNTRNEGAILRNALQSLQTRMLKERDILIPVDQTLSHSDFNMAKTTTWAVQGVGGPEPHGKLWQAAVAMDEFSQATISSAGALAQANAIRYGGRQFRWPNLGTVTRRAGSGFLTPVLPQMPARAGTFMDFSPLLQGRERVGSDTATYAATGGAGGAIPDMAYPHRLGPYARLLKWRDEWRRWNRGTFVGPNTQVRGANGGVNLGGRQVGASAITQASGQWTGSSSEVLGYSTVGPYMWAIRQILYWAGPYGGRYSMDGRLADTYFTEYTRQISRVKLNYMFGSRKPQKIHYPIWKTSYPEARQLANDPRYRVNRTMYYLVQIASSVPEGAAGWLTQGTYRANSPPPDDAKHRPIAIWVRGWSDLTDRNLPMVHDYVWKDTYTYQTTNDPEIGIKPVDRNGDGKLDFQPVYMVSFYFFGGIDIGGDVEISNPCNWKDGTPLPKPMLLDISQGDYDAATPNADAGVRRKQFTFLGVSRINAVSQYWQSQFRAPNPTGKMTAVAQAELFNSTSWDLWTQDWRAQLVPVSQWSDWISQMNKGAGDTAPANAYLQQRAEDGTLSQSDIEETADFLGRLDPKMAEMYINH